MDGPPNEPKARISIDATFIYFELSITLASSFLIQHNFNEKLNFDSRRGLKGKMSEYCAVDVQSRLSKLQTLFC